MHARDFRETHVTPEPRSHVRHTNPWTQSPWDRLPNEALFLRPPRGTPNGLRGAWETARSSLQNHGPSRTPDSMRAGARGQLCTGSEPHLPLLSVRCLHRCQGLSGQGSPPPLQGRALQLLPGRLRGPQRCQSGAHQALAGQTRSHESGGPGPAPSHVTSPQASPEGGLGAAIWGLGTPAAAPDSRPPISQSRAPGCAGGRGGGGGASSQSPIRPPVRTSARALPLPHSCDFRPGVCPLRCPSETPCAPSSQLFCEKSPRHPCRRLKCTIPRL